jgi:hypothetical protein
MPRPRRAQQALPRQRPRGAGFVVEIHANPNIQAAINARELKTQRVVASMTTKVDNTYCAMPDSLKQLTLYEDLRPVREPQRNRIFYISDSISPMAAAEVLYARVHAWLEANQGEIGRAAIKVFYVETADEKTPGQSKYTSRKVSETVVNENAQPIYADHVRLTRQDKGGKRQRRALDV